MFSEKQMIAGGTGVQEPFIFTIDTRLDAPYNSFTFAAKGNRLTIDWGDNTTSTTATSIISHTYVSSGTYTISILGQLDSIASYYNAAPVFFESRKITDINQWGTTIWTSWSYPPPYEFGIFQDAINLPQTISAVDTPNLKNCISLRNAFFAVSTDFNTALNDWDVKNVTNFQNTFNGCALLNQPMNNWNMSNATIIQGMFGGCNNFNQDISGWDTGKVTNMAGVFSDAYNFNQPIGTWNTGNVTLMQNMFTDALAFNQNINTWNVSKVTNMSAMFSKSPGTTSTNFNQSLSNWDVGNVTNIDNMFIRNTSFNQDLGMWNIDSLALARNTFANSAMSTENYSRTLVGWANYVYNNSGPYSVNMSGQTTMKYNSSTYGTGVFTNAVAARTYLVNSATWTISGDIAV